MYPFALLEDYCGHTMEDEGRKNKEITTVVQERDDEYRDKGRGSESRKRVLWR